MTSAWLTHWALPVAASALPWRAGFRVLQGIAGSSVSMPLEDDAWHGWLACRDLFPRGSASAPAGEHEWRARWRLVHLVDHADLFLVSTRSDRWLERHARVAGTWPRRGPFLAVTMHWGAGLWALRHLRRSGARARFLSARFDQRSFGGHRARLAYARMRVGALERITGARVLYTGGASEQIVSAWNAGVAVIALCDVAPAGASASIAAAVGAATLVMPRGLVRLAVASAIPVVTFSCGIDVADGTRHIDIGEARVFASESELADSLGCVLGALIDRDAAAWHMWPYATQLLSRDARSPIASMT